MVAHTSELVEKLVRSHTLVEKLVRMCSVLVYEALSYVLGSSHSDVLLQRERESVYEAFSYVLGSSDSDVILHLYGF